VAARRRSRRALSVEISVPIAFKIYDKSVTMSLEKFCGILGIPMFGTAKKIQNRAADLLELY
jgi:hypothetical protein